MDGGGGGFEFHTSSSIRARLARELHTEAAKKPSIDNVFADAEAILDTCAWFDAVFAHPYFGTYDLNESALAFTGRTAAFIVHSIVAWVWNYVLLVLVLSTALPGAFVLLLLRSQTVETESVAFTQRERVLDAETTSQRSARWLGFLSRALPMALFLCGWPALLCFEIFPRVEKRAGAVLGLLGAHLFALLALQTLGVLRAARSWRQSQVEGKHRGVKPALRPHFSWKKPMHVVLAGTLLLEMIQLSTLPLQGRVNASRRSSSSSSSSSSSYTLHTSLNAPHWLESLGNIAFLRVSALSSVQVPWVADAALPVCLVAALLLLIGVRIARDIKTFGSLKYPPVYNRRTHPLASEFLFRSFTGAIIYAHGRPANVSARLKAAVVVLSDALFLTILERLLAVLRCHSTGAGYSVLLIPGAHQEVQCWTGQHTTWAFLALAALSYYVPTSIMLSPMLLQSPDSTDAEENITFVKLFSMVTTVLKCCSLMVALLAYSSTLSTLVVYLLISLFLALLTAVWTNLYSTDAESMAEPCTDPFFSHFRTAAYCSATWCSLWALALSGSTTISDSTRNTLLSVVVPLGWGMACMCVWLLHRAPRPEQGDGPLSPVSVESNTIELLSYARDSGKHSTLLHCPDEAPPPVELCIALESMYAVPISAANKQPKKRTRTGDVRPTVWL
jgi:hypothetical protein